MGGHTIYPGGIALNMRGLDHMELDEESGITPWSGDLSEIERTQSLLKGTDLRELIELNGPVRAAIDDWLTWMRPNLMTAYENYQFLKRI